MAEQFMGIEFSTDATDKARTLVPLAREIDARRWLAEDAGYRYPELADAKLPASESNFHTIKRKVYVMAESFVLNEAEWRKEHEGIVHTPWALSEEGAIGRVYSRHAIRILYPVPKDSITNLGSQSTP